MPISRTELSHIALRRSRVGVMGGSSISKPNEQFCFALGKTLAKLDGAILVHGGYKRNLHRPGLVSASFATISGAVETFVANNIDLNSRIETLLPEQIGDHVETYEIGQIRRLTHRNLEGRRFALVSATDALVAIQGHKQGGTHQVIELAIAIERPILPLPFTGGGAQKGWGDYRELICDWFQINDEQANRFEAIELDSLSPQQLSALAEKVVSLLQNQLNPNVMYELGLVHAQGKPVILLHERDESTQNPKLPFDIQAETTLFYAVDNLDELRRNLGQILSNL